MNEIAENLYDFFDNFMDCLHDAVLIVQGDKIVFANHSVERVLGYEPEELIGSSLDRLVPEKFRDSHRQWVQSAIKNKYARKMSERPVISAVTKSGEEISVAVTFGHTDYDGTPFHVAVVRDVSDEVAEFRKVVDIAEHDVLTGLGNRLYLSRQMALRRNKKKAGYALLFMDLNKFKPINDQYGHNAGDKVLKIIARRISACIRPQDIAVRFGGDEFVVLIDGVRDIQTINRISSDLYASVKKPMRVEGDHLQVTVAIGASIYPDSAIDETGLLDVADKAMYAAKEREYGYMSSA